MEKNKYLIPMTAEEMIRYYANKIVEDGIRNCQEYSNTVSLRDHGDGIKLEKYKNEILKILYRDERVTDVFVDGKEDLHIVFYAAYCPFYIETENETVYNIFYDSPAFQKRILQEFIDYMNKSINEMSYISTKNLIDSFVEARSMDPEFKERMYNFLKKNIIETGFVDNYIENIDVYVTYKNCKELEDGLLEIIKQKENIEENEFE